MTHGEPHESSPMIRLVLFDLDGTLADTAPDLAATVNRMRARRGHEPLPLAELRPLASHGARGLIGRAFGIRPDDTDYETLRQEFFSEYESALCRDTALFPQMEETLQTIESHGIRWGIVTNKIARFTDPLVRALNLSERTACVVSGDTTPHAKPHPAPLLHAAACAGVPVDESVYVGDDLRDIQAGRAAGVGTVAAAYGYLGDGAPVEAWGADHIIRHPEELLAIVVRRSRNPR
jgi:2-phosphoglycolate phosphatase